MNVQVYIEKIPYYFLVGGRRLKTTRLNTTYLAAKKNLGPGRKHEEKQERKKKDYTIILRSSWEISILCSKAEKRNQKMKNPILKSLHAVVPSRHSYIAQILRVMTSSCALKEF